MAFCHRRRTYTIFEYRDSQQPDDVNVSFDCWLSQIVRDGDRRSTRDGATALPSVRKVPAVARIMITKKNLTDLYNTVRAFQAALADKPATELADARALVAKAVKAYNAALDAYGTDTPVCGQRYAESQRLLHDADAIMVRNSLPSIIEEEAAGNTAPTPTPVPAPADSDEGDSGDESTDESNSSAPRDDVMVLLRSIQETCNSTHADLGQRIDNLVMLDPERVEILNGMSVDGLRAALTRTPLNDGIAAVLNEGTPDQLRQALNRPSFTNEEMFTLRAIIAAFGDSDPTQIQAIMAALVPMGTGVDRLQRGLGRVRRATNATAANGSPTHN